MKVHFASFSGGSEELRLAAERIHDEALKSKYFDEIHVCNERNAYPKLKNYLNINSNILNSRGYGYWSWKPQFLLDVFDKASAGDVICYADAGCQISLVALKQFKENVRICKQLNSLFFHMPYNIEKFYTKKKLFEYFDCENDHDIINTPQIQATYFYIEVTNANLDIVNNWAQISQLDNFSFIDDSNSYGYDDTFIDHRHDQSILSILIKKAKIKTYPHKDYFENKDYYINSKIMLYPIHALRNRSGKQRHSLTFNYSNDKMISSTNYIIIFINKILYIIPNLLKFHRTIVKLIIIKIFNLMGFELIRTSVVKELKNCQIDYYRSEKKIQLIQALSYEASQISSLLGRLQTDFQQVIFVLSFFQFKRNGFYLEIINSNELITKNSNLLNSEFDWDVVSLEFEKISQISSENNFSCEDQENYIFNTNNTDKNINSKKPNKFKDGNLYNIICTERNFIEKEQPIEKLDIFFDKIINNSKVPINVDCLLISVDNISIEILSFLDFDKINFKTIAFKHDYQIIRKEAFKILIKNNYIRKHEQYTKNFDWYVKEIL